MHQLYRDPIRTFAHRLILGCALVAAASLLLLLGAWLNSFTVSRPRAVRPVVPPPVTVTVTAVSAAPVQTPETAGPSLPAGADGAAQTACAARVQAVALRKAGRKREAAVQDEAAQEAALASTAPDLEKLKGMSPRKFAAGLDAWCGEHFPGLGPKPSRPRPKPTRPDARGPVSPSPECPTPGSRERGRPSPGESADDLCVGR